MRLNSVLGYRRVPTLGSFLSVPQPYYMGVSGQPILGVILRCAIQENIAKCPSQVLCWGVRDMKRYQLLKVSSPLVELECGGTIIQSKPIEDASKDSNFPHHIITMDVVSSTLCMASF